MKTSTNTVKRKEGANKNMKEKKESGRNERNFFK